MPTQCLHPTPINDAGLTDAQRLQAVRDAQTQGWRCYAAWVATLDPTTLPYSTLPHTGMQADFGPPTGNSLSEAKAGATLIVSGTVLSISPQTSFATKVTIAVTQVLKGQSGNTITITQASHLEPLDNSQDQWQGVLIVDAYAAPLLLPGDSVFLFLKSYPQGLGQEIITGTYYVRLGQIQALQLNPFASQVNGQSPSDFVTAIANA
jgi:hypothetical protein